jgi:hypothetical protein
MLGNAMSKFLFYIRENPSIGILTATGSAIMSFFESIEPVLRYVTLSLGCVIAILTVILKGIDLYDIIKQRIISKLKLRP